ncbi:MAG TPA: peroxiredoxin [Steroidobacteraceae bacterium]|nr:peroxiredoxin [Steroidobacteraceae bacterium]
MSKIEVGKRAPAFTLDGSGGRWSLEDAAGANLILYFYPRDNTPGCTQEGESFTAVRPQLKRLNTLIVGVSPDTVASHEKFKKKMGFTFELLSDPDRAVCKLYDVIREKSMYGKKYMGVERSTFLIDAKGVLRGEWRKVKVSGHAEAVLAAVKAL